MIENVAFPNKCRIQADGKTVIVKNGVPGQMVRFSVNKVRKGKAEGRILEVLKKSPLECEPVCKHFVDCGGCTYQNLPYEEQLHLKEEQVKTLLDDAVSPYGYEYIFEGIKESPSHYDYRNKMEFSFGDEVKDGPLALGMHKRGSFYDIVTVNGCRIADEDFRMLLTATLNYFREKSVPFYRKMQHTGYLRHLLVRKAVKTGEILVDLVTSTQMEADLTEWKDLLLELPLKGKLAGILHTSNDSLADVIQNDGTEVLYGQEFFYEELLDLRFRITPFSFFQTNSLGAEVLYETARGYIGDTKDQLLFDLYSGTGTIAQILAPVAKKVIGVEIVEEAVEAAKENARLNGLSNCEFIAGDVLKMLDTIEERPDFIVLDPPRDGIHPKALKKIIDYGVEKMVYISCKPTSLARDLEMLQECGYRMVKACCVDMFPWTANVETVVLLTRKSGGGYQVEIDIPIHCDESGELAKEEKATYSNIKKYVHDKFGVDVHTSYIAQVKRFCGMNMRDCYNKSKKENPAIKRCTEEKAEYIKEALRYYNVI